jgi:hypothetical protein
MNRSTIYILGIIIILVGYNAILMRMLPFSKVSFKCEFASTSIKSYKLPKRLDLTINGYGYGKFTNKQMFENNSFKLKTSNPRDKFFNRLFGTSAYHFYIGKKNTEYPETYMFSIAKKDNRANERVLIFSDYANDGNEDPMAMFYCNHI